MPASYSQEILDTYPQPLAATYARFLDQRDPAAQHTILLALFEALLKYLASAAAARYLASDGEDPAVATALGTLRRSSLGHWAALLRSSLAWWSRQDHPDQEFVLPELPSLYAPLVIALDNYSVHTSQTIVAAQPHLAAANVELVYLYEPSPRGGDRRVLHMPPALPGKHHEAMIRRCYAPMGFS